MTAAIIINIYSNSHVMKNDFFIFDSGSYIFNDSVVERFKHNFFFTQ